MADLKLGAGSALVVVAHPDDETIWMGGTILNNPQINWTIFSLCRADDQDRSPKFKRVAKYLGARGIISDLEDEGKLNIKESVPEIHRRIRRELKQKHFTYVFTHGYNGEYGHPRHKGAHRAVRELLVSKKIRTDKLFYFAYKLDEKRGFAVPERTAAIALKLSSQVLRKKQKIINELYGFSKDSFEHKSCATIETFSI